MDSAKLTAAIKDEAHSLGFAQVGICPAVTPSRLHRFHEWLDAGYAGEMLYLSNRRDAYTHPRYILDGARSLIMLTTPYPAKTKGSGALHRNTPTGAPTGDTQGTQGDAQGDTQGDTGSTDAQGDTQGDTGSTYESHLTPLLQTGQGDVSCYAWGQTDYHDVIHSRLKQLAAWLNSCLPNSHARGIVDTAPLLEREFAQLAGLGWIGKNTMLIDRKFGSWFFLAALLTDVELEYDAPHETDHCGTCTACIDACPTSAFLHPHVLDATRCISYLTIESREIVPTDLRVGLGDWIFGCDVCQEVCPWNNHIPVSKDPSFTPRDDTNSIDLITLFDLDNASFRNRFRKTPLWRTKRRGLLRNAAIVLGNQRAKNAISALTRGLDDEEALIREACQWALTQITTAGSKRCKP